VIFGERLDLVSRSRFAGNRLNARTNQSEEARPMPRSEREPAGGSNELTPAARAFLALSSDGTAELDRRSLRKSAAAMVILFLVLLAAPLYWVTHAQASAADQPLAVKSDGDSGDDSGPGGGDDDDDHGDDGPNATHPGNTGASASAFGNATHPGNTGPGASHHGGQGHGGDDTNNGQQTNATNENTATNTANTGTGPNTNTN